MALLYASIFALTLTSAMAGISLKSRRFGEAFLFALSAIYSAVSIVGAAVS